ncbi:MAG: 3',5'-cyclic adenosine monophosphate phosphodiesterase CpdA [Chlamydiae bacterium]|nr:3',5'-cyclic adenosine monophosphate phosphodiesterase CpdA [Chlamydiota bacterium]
MKKDPASLRVAHLSDPHFSRVTYHPSQFLSKRWLGNLNLFLFRRKSYQTDHLGHIPELLDTLEVEQVFFTGDFSSTALDEEFEAAKAYVESFSMPVSLLPGNHDAYTKEAERSRRFYDFFPNTSLEKDRIEVTELGKGWWWIGLDCAVATPLFHAYGLFTPEMEAKLEAHLQKLPEGARVILGNHFPLYPSFHHTHDLKRNEALQKLLIRYPTVKLYLHGHDHKPYIKEKSTPLVFNSGSCAHKPDGTFYLFDLFEEELLCQRLLFRKENDTFSWVVDWQKSFLF